MYNKAEIKDGYLIAIIDKQKNRFEYSQSWQPKKITAELIGGKRVEKEAYSLKAVSFVNWVKVKEDEGKPNTTVKSEDVKAYKQQTVTKFYSGIDAFSIKLEQVHSCSGGLQIVESYDAQGKPVCRSISEFECENFQKTKSIFGAGNAEIVKACKADAYYQPHELMPQAADGTTTWGEKLVKQLNYSIAQNSKNKFGDNVLAAKLDGVKYIEPGSNYRGDDVFQSKYTLEELNNKMAYLEISTGYQFYTRFIDSWCSFAQTDADKFAKDVFTNSNISKEKGIYCMVLYNSRIAIDNPAAFTFAFAFGSQVKDSVIIKTTLLSTPPSILVNYTTSLIQSYKLIKKKKVTYYYYVKAVSQTQIAAWPGSGNCNGSNCPHYSPLTANILSEIKTEDSTTGNAIEAQYFITDTNSDNQQYIKNTEYDLKEEYVTSTSKDVAILYGEKFGNWKLYGWDGTQDNQGSHITYSTKPVVGSCKFTLGKPCSQVLIDNIITVANLVAVPFGWPVIIPVATASVIYYGATGQWDEAGLYLASYLLPPVAIEIVRGVASVTSTIIRFTIKGVAATLSQDLRVALEFREVVNRGLSEQAMQTLFSKQINTACAEYIIPNGTYKNLWVKITQNEAMVGSFDLVNGETKLTIRGYVNGKSYNVSSLTESSVNSIAEDLLLGNGKVVSSQTNLITKNWINNIQGWKSLTNALSFWNNTSNAFEHLISPDFYIKFDKTTGNLLLGNFRTGEILGFYEGIANATIVDQKGLQALLSKLKTYHGSSGAPSYVSSNVSSGARIISNPNKTATIVGNFQRYPYNLQGMSGDMKTLTEEICGNLKTQQFGAKKGGFNILNVADERVSDWGRFWDDFNEPWLKDAINRGDDIWAASNPMDKTILFKDVSGLPEINDAAEIYKYFQNPAKLPDLTGFGKEVKTLIDNGYQFNSSTKMFIK